MLYSLAVCMYFFLYKGLNNTSMLALLFQKQTCVFSCDKMHLVWGLNIERKYKTPERHCQEFQSKSKVRTLNQSENPFYNSATGKTCV